MATTVGRRLLRAAALGSVLALTFLGPPARADSSTTSFLYGPDSTNWYWRDQVEETAAVGPVAQPITLGNPQAPDTLPVAAQKGEMNKISAIRFDLAERGIETGATVTSFVLTIAESGGELGDPTQPDLQQSFNTEGKLLQACPITGDWSGGDGAELWERRPAFDEGGCVAGQRQGTGDAAAWSFDLTSAAAGWAEDPVSNRGVMLTPVQEQGGAPTDATWQINLKIPARDESDTPGADEYEQTTGRVQVDVSFTSPEPAAASGTSTTPSFSGGSSGLGGFGGTPSFSGDPGNPFDGATSTTGGGSPQSAQDRAIASRRPAPSVPKLPWYVWILIPVGLVALSTVRAVVLEPISGGKPGGVIAAIRIRNAEFRGAGPRATGAVPRREAPLPAILSLGALGKRSWEAARAWATGARRKLRGR